MEKSRLEYKIIPADIDESIFDDLDVKERVVKLAYEKCKLIAEQYPDHVVIGADTLTADTSGKVFTKPKPGTDPLDSAMRLSGQIIDVYTGCCVYTPEEKFQETLAVAQIKYQNFDRNNLERLAEGDSPQIRSGALGVFVDAPGFTLIESVQGSYTGMYGLPMEFVYAQIDKSK